MKNPAEIQKGPTMESDLMQRLEALLEELDSMNLFQTAARLSGVIDTLQHEIESRTDARVAHLIGASEPE